MLARPWRQRSCVPLRERPLCVAPYIRKRVRESYLRTKCSPKPLGLGHWSGKKQPKYLVMAISVRFAGTI